MIKFKLLDGRTSLARKIKEEQEKLTKARDLFFEKTINLIVESSPVDTGTYMDSHHINKTTGVTYSDGKPQNQSKELHAGMAKERLMDEFRDIDKGNHAYISNNSQHAPLVEYELSDPETKEPYMPYTKARQNAPNIWLKAAKESGL